MNRHLKLAVFDIDGTLRRARSPWRQMHEYLGVYEKARPFRIQWERGEISYEDWAHLDASLWKGYSQEYLQNALNTNPLRDGAIELVQWFVRQKIPCIGISSGLSVFNEITAILLSMDEIVCNHLHFDGDICTGEVTVRVTENNKEEMLDQVLSHHSVSHTQAITFGDGIADIPLLKKTHLSIAICPLSEQVRRAAKFSIEEEPIDRAIDIIQNHYRKSKNE